MQRYNRADLLYETIADADIFVLFFDRIQFQYREKLRL
jgi:hypothetical protein